MLILASFFVNCSQSSNEQRLQIFQGIIPSASGPGIELTLFLYADGESVLKFTYISREQTHDYEFGTWKIADKVLTISPLETDGFGLEFLINGNYLVFSHDGKELYAGVDRATLIKISQ